MRKGWLKAHIGFLWLVFMAQTVFAYGASVAWAQARGAPILEFAQETSAQGVVNIQTASAEELQRLPGIGPSKAEAIIAYRSRHPFRRIEDIMRVRGIGRATFRRLQPYLTVSGPTTLLSKVHLRAQK